MHYTTHIENRGEKINKEEKLFVLYYMIKIAERNITSRHLVGGSGRFMGKRERTGRRGKDEEGRE